MDTSDNTTNPATRTCPSCQKTFLATTENFYLIKGKLDTYCKTCKIAKTKVWQDANAERVKEIKRKSAEKHRESNNAKAKERYHNDTGYRERVTASTEKWEKANPEKRRESARRRSKTDEYREKNRIAQKIRKENTNITEQDILEMWEELEGRCAYCGISIFLDLSRDVFTDHMIPIVRGGSGNRDNMTVCCGPCNSQKWTRTVEEWKAVRGW